MSKSRSLKKPIAFRLDPTICEELRKMCESTGISQTEMLEELISAHLDDIAGKIVDRNSKGYVTAIAARQKKVKSK